MSATPTPQQALNFNNVGNNWPSTIIDMDDHERSVRLQFDECEKQNREFPFYGVIFGTIMPFLCTLFSARASLRLEGTPQAELMFTGTCSGAEKRKLLDNDFEEEGEEEEEEEAQPGKKLTRDQRDLIASNAAFDGPQWAKTSSKAGRKDNAKRMPASKAPDSQRVILSASTVTDSDDVEFQILRVTDGMFMARAGTRERENVKIPAVSVEVKVPNAQRTPRGASITAAEAVEEFHKAIPQVVQHAQFIFHQWPELSMIWTMTTCGRYVVFRKFTAAKTPKVDYMKTAGGWYYRGDISEITMTSTSAKPMVDREGRYTPWFKKQWPKIMDEVEVEYTKMG